MSQPTATALLPCHNEARTIGAVVAAVRAQTYPISAVIVVADACTDDTTAVAREAGALVIETDCADKAGAQNHVLPLIGTDLVVGFDGDTLPEPDCVERMVARMERDQLAAACATVLPIQTRGMFIRARQYAYALGRRWWRIAQSAVGCPQVLTGAAYVFRTPAIKAIGGFPTVGISADMDATWALMAAGHRLAYVGDALAYTYDPETFSQYRAQMRRWAAGYFQTMAKHRRQLLRPKAMLVVWTGLFDLLTLPVTYGIAAWWLLTDPARARWLPAWFLGHLAVTTVLVATVVGWRDALLGAVPYTIVNVYNKGLYLWTLFREWVLGRHYATWTGRAGRAKKIAPMSRRRAAALTGCATVLVAGLAVQATGALWRSEDRPVMASSWPGVVRIHPGRPPTPKPPSPTKEPAWTPAASGQPSPPSVPTPAVPAPPGSRLATAAPTGTATPMNTTTTPASGPNGTQTTTSSSTPPIATPTTTAPPPTTTPPTTQPPPTTSLEPSTTTPPTTTQGSTSTWPSTSAPPSDPPATSTAAPGSWLASPSAGTRNLAGRSPGDPRTA